MNRWGLLLPLLLLVALFVMPARAVTEISDDSEDSLNQAFQDAALDDGIIVFDDDFTIQLSAPMAVDADALGEPDNGFVLDTQGHSVSINGAAGVRVFEVLNGANLTMIGVTVANGQTNQGGGLYISGDSSVLMTNCTLIGNKATGTNGAAGAPGSNSDSGSGGNGKSGQAGESVAGAAIYNLGSLALFNCVLASNTATGGTGGTGGNGGSGVFNAGSGGNGGAGGSARGGGIYCSNTNEDTDVIDFPLLVISNCTFSANAAMAGNGGAGGAPGATGIAGLQGTGGAGGAAWGGGLLSSNSVVIVASTFSGNAATGGTSAAGGTQSSGNGVNGATGGAANGAGIFALDASITNSTFYFNNTTGGTGGNGGPGTGNAGDGGNGGNATGGGFYSVGASDVIACTFSNCNAFGGSNGVAGSPGIGGVNGSHGANRGGEIARGGTPRFQLGYTILATNASGGAGYQLGSADDLGYNIYWGNSITLASGSIKTNNANLGPLSNNGGLTMTMLPQLGSPALDRIPTTAYHSVLVDQRGIPRPINTSVDIGSVELEQQAGPPVITIQPTNPPVILGSNATISVTAVGLPSLRYYWLSNNVFMSNGLARTSIVISNAAASNAGPYMVIVSNSLGTVRSTPVFFGFIPSITNAPGPDTINNGDSAAFAVTAIADPANLTFQWFFNGDPIDGATNFSVLAGSNVFTSSLTVTNAQTDSSGAYTVGITNVYGGTMSAPAALNIKPGINVQPTNQTVVQGATTFITVDAGGTPPLTYQWRFNGDTNAFSGINQGTLPRANAQLSFSGVYDVIITNAFGSITSQPAIFTVVTSAPAPHLNAASATGQFNISFPTTPGATYILDSRTNVLSGSWLPIATNPGNGGTMQFSIPLTNRSGFFRVRVR